MKSKLFYAFLIGMFAVACTSTTKEDADESSADTEAAVEEVVLLCFPYNTFTNTDERKKCRSYNGKDIKELNTKSKYEHTYAGVNLGKYKNRPFVVDGFDTRETIPDIGLHGKAESLELGIEVDNGWKLEATYPFHIR